MRNPDEKTTKLIVIVALAAILGCVTPLLAPSENTAEAWASSGRVAAAIVADAVSDVSDASASSAYSATSTYNATASPRTGQPRAGQPSADEQTGPLPPVLGLGEGDLSKLDAQTGNPVIDIPGDNVPLGNLAVSGAWSLASFTLCLASLLFALLFSSRVLSILRSKSAEGETIMRRLTGTGAALRVLALLMSLVSLLVWLVLDDTSKPMSWVNSYTIVFGTLFLSELLLAVIAVFTYPKDDREQRYYA
jgi:hypothetical protein